MLGVLFSVLYLEGVMRCRVLAEVCFRVREILGNITSLLLFLSAWRISIGVS